MHEIVIPFVIAIAIILYDSFKRFKLWFLGYILIFVGFVLYVSAFLFDDFTLAEVYYHSSKSLSPIFKFSASWSGSGGFIVWWLFVFTLVVFLKRLRNEENYVYYNLTIVALFFIALLNSAFDSMQFTPKNGMGLNPLLKNIWMLMHPPATFIGYAFGLLVAISKEERIYTNLAWFFITLANVLGGIWSYFTLGWGGYWAWDPVETSLLLPWLCLTAYFHSLNKESLKYLVGFSIVFAAFVTRGGISILHGFAVNPAGLAIIVLGIPFLIKAVKSFRFKGLNPMEIVSYSLLGSYIVCLASLIYQSIFAFLGVRVSVNVEYYVFANMPFLITLLSVLPVCRSEISKKYLKSIVLVFFISALFAILALRGLIVICKDISPLMNIAGAFVLPIAVFSLLYSLKLKDINLKIIHISIVLLIIGVTISWPYAYYENYKFVLLKRGKITEIDGCNVSLESLNFYKPSGTVSIDSITIPEESVEIVKIKVDEREIPVKLRLNIPLLISHRSFIYSEPVVINNGLDNLYIVVLPSKFSLLNSDLFMFTCKYFYEKNKTHMLMVISEIVGLNYEELVKNLKNWKPSNEVIAIYKRIPLVNLVWISCCMMLIGELISILRGVKK